jgi:hypothetical protein
MAATMTVEGKVAGQKRPLFEDREIPLPPEAERPGGQVLLRDLITRVVLEEVARFRERQEERRLIRVLTEGEIRQGVERGKIEMGGREEKEGEVDPQAAVETALLAFQDGLYYVFIDGDQKTDLDQAVSLKAESRVTFLRLVALAGG